MITFLLKLLKIKKVNDHSCSQWINVKKKLLFIKLYTIKKAVEILNNLKNTFKNLCKTFLLLK